MTRLFAGTPFDIPPTCDRCGKRGEECECAPEPPTPTRIAPEKQTAKVRLEKRKHGRTVTVVAGLPAEGNDLPQLLTQLKGVCGAGGTIKNEQIEIQGDHVERVNTTLGSLGYRLG